MAKNKKQTKKIGGPFLAVAVVCDALLEDSGGRISAMGISDSCNFYITHDAPPNVPSKEHPVTAQQNILLIFRTGDAPGKHSLKIVMEQPDGKRKTMLEREIELTATMHGGCQIKMQSVLTVYTHGVYMFDVYLDSKRVTRMPFGVNFQRLPPPTGVPEKNPKKNK